MNINEMRHTCWRCRNGYYEIKDAPMRCRANVVLKCRADEETCKHFEPTETAEAFFSGKLKGSQYNTLASIYLERQRKGTF